jgi:molybdopterin-guanine dinucleotide biosynthesis protein A
MYDAAAGGTPAVPVVWSECRRNKLGAIEGFILAGGQSRRMGTDKSRLTIKGQTFLERIAEEISGVVISVAVVGAGSAPRDMQLPNSKVRQTGMTVLPDLYPNWGALGGVHAALSACASEWALVVACDFPFVTRELFTQLAERREDFEAVAPVQGDLIPQPLCSLYKVAPCLLRAEQLIKSGERKPIALLQSVRTRWVSFDEIADLQGAGHFFDNINTPEDYDRMVEKGIDYR